MPKTAGIDLPNLLMDRTAYTTIRDNFNLKRASRVASTGSHSWARAVRFTQCVRQAAAIADNWGVYMYAFYLFVLTIWWSINWGDATACPYTHIEDLVQGTKSLRDAFLLIWAELVGGLAIFRYVQVLWAMEIVSTHRNRAFGDCSTDLQVPVIFGALVECVATCICRVASRVLSETNPRFGGILDSFVGTSLVVAAFNYSGGYFNPALATSLKYGCFGTTFMEHVIVYWVGACAGSILSLRVYQMSTIQNFVNRRKEKIQ